MAEGVGTVTLKLFPMNLPPMDVTIHDALYVPDLDENLISVRKLNEKGLDVLFSCNKCFLIEGEDKILIGEYTNTLFRLFTQSQDRVKTVVEEKYRCVHEWHRVLAHRNVADIQKMGKFGLPVKKCSCNFECEACIKGKLSRKPFKKSKNPVKEVLEVIASDLCGPLHVESLGRARYFITFTDLYSGYCEVFPIRAKEDTPTITKRFIEKLMNLTGKRPKIFRSDRGTEFLNKDLQDYLSDKGIKFQCTTGYASQQNGAAERQNRTLMEAARTVLADSELPKTFWGEAVKYAAFMNNRIVNKKHGKTPLELMFDMKPNFNDLYMFGHPVYVLTPNQKRRKLDVKAEKGIYVGHDELSKGYRIADPNSYKISVSRDVEFLKRDFIPDTARTVDLTDVSVIKNESEDELEDESGSDDESDESSNSNNESEQDEEEDEFFDASDSSSSSSDDQNQPLRRSTRSNFGQRPKYLNNYHVYVAKQNEAFEPRTFKEALNCHERDCWISAMQEELQSIENNDTWELVDLPKGRSTIGSKWVYKLKVDELGGNHTYKARLVAQGFSQKFGVDYDEVFAPVARTETFRILLTVAGKNGFGLKQYDFKTAFLNGELKEEIFMRPPQGVPSDGKVLKLKKSLYGLKQAAKVWHDSLHGVLVEHGCVQSQHDKCLYVATKSDSKVFLIVHVDDLLVAFNDESLLNSIISAVGKVYQLKDLGTARHYLGIDIQRSQSGAFNISQSRYIDKVVEEARLTDAKESKYPLDPGYHKLDGGDLLPSNEEYRKLIGMLLYLSINTRPDIAASVAILSQKTSKPTTTDLNEVKRVIRYIKGTKSMKLCLKGTSDCILSAYSDADWAEDRVDRKSNSGYIVNFMGSVVAWSCRKQSVIALSSCEAEYVALSEVAKELSWLRNLVSDFGFDVPCPIIVGTDSQSSIALSKEGKSSNRTKHMDVRFHYIKDLCSKGVIKLVYVSTQDNIADMFTKPLSSVRLGYLRSLARFKIEEE